MKQQEIVSYFRNYSVCTYSSRSTAFFLKFKNFTATVRHFATSPLELFSTWSNLSIKQSDNSFHKDRTSGATYNPRISASPTNPSLHCVSYWQTSKIRTRLLHWRDWQKPHNKTDWTQANDQERRCNNHIAEHHRLTNHTTDWDLAQCLTYSTNCFQRLTLESWFTNFKNRLSSTGINHYRHHTNDSFTTLTLQTNRTERPNFTDRSTLTNHNRLTPLESYSQ